MGNFHTTLFLAFAFLSTVVHAGNLVIRTGPIRQPSCVDYTPFVYAGCFEDVGNPRTLLYSSDLDRQTMTVDKCVAFCKGNGYKYTGLEYYGECYCGTSVNAVQIEESNCNFPCNGNKTESCGGGKIISIYQDPTFEVVSNSTVSDYMSMGCYSEGSNGRTLGWRQDNVDIATLTVEKCLSACLHGGYSFAGVEFGRECYCGVVLGNGTLPLDAAECDMRCTGDKTQFCGGRSRLNLYIAKHLESTKPCGSNGTVSSSSSSSISPTSTPASLSSSSSETTSTSLTTSPTSPSSSSILSTASSTFSTTVSLSISSTEHPISSSTGSPSLLTSSTISTSSSSFGVLPTPITTSMEYSTSSLSTTSDPPLSTSGTTSNELGSSSTFYSSRTSSETSSRVFATPVITSPESSSSSSKFYTLSSSGGTTSVESSTTITSSASSTSYHSSEFSYTTTSRTAIPYTSTAYSSTASVTYTRTSTSWTTTTSFEICTSYYNVYPPPPSLTCAYKLGKWCATPFPEFSDTITCLKAFASCVSQLSICPLKAGYPDLLKCSQFGDYCSRIADYCDDYCPGYKCSLSSCRQAIPPYGVPPMPTQGPGILQSSLYTCPSFTTPTPTILSTTPAMTTTTSSRQTNPTTAPAMPKHTNICTQPNNPTYGYPLGGYPIPNLSCNNEWVDYNNGHPFKLYTSPDTYKCPSYGPSGNNGPIQGCRDACDEQYRLCETGYAEPYNGNDYLSACKRCSKQKDECYLTNKDVGGGGKCESFD